MRALFTWLVLCGLLVSGFSQHPTTNELFGDRVELYFSFPDPGVKTTLALSKTISMDHKKEGRVYAYASKKEFLQFLNYGIDFQKEIAPGLLTPVKMKDNIDIKSVEDWDFYPTYEAYLNIMYQFEADYPGLCEIVNFGQSTNGRDLLCARISDNIGTDEGEPQFLYTGTMHGDETAGYILSLRLINYLLENYGSNAKVDNLVNNMEIWINPLANPDGTYNGGNSTVFGSIRYNANGVDLNRNYPDPQDGPHPDGNEWQVETIAFMQLAEDNHFVSSSNFHGGAEVCNYPWDTWSQLTPDDEWWQYVCHEYADTAQFYSPPGFMDGFDDGITNGYAWYTTNGNRQDYMNYFHQCREFTLELSDIKTLPQSQLDAWWGYNYRSLLNFMEQSLFGVSGAVTDANSGDPLYAEVFIENHDQDSSWVYTYDINGKYYRMLYEGSYDITFSAEGYYPQTIENVMVENRQLTTLDVQLVPGDLIVDFAANNTSVPIGTTVDFTDLSFGNIVSWEWEFEGGTPATSTQQNPENIMYNEEGSYDVSLTISNGTDSQTITKEDYINVSVEFLMQTTTITTCTGIFYDSGGADESYDNDEDFILTILPGETNGKVICEFTSFNVEFDDACDYDWLSVYNGPNTNSPLIGTYCGTDSPGTVTADNEDGALTFQFHSDYSVTESGWVANISCEVPVLPPLADFIADADTIIEGNTVHFTDMTLNNPETWDWVFEGGDPATSTLQNPEVVYPVAGTYSVTLTTTNAGGSNTITKEDFIVVEEATYVEKFEAGFDVYPNPANDKVVVISEKATIDGVSMRNLTGQIVYNEFVSAAKAIIDVSNLESGIYFLEISVNDRVIVKKVAVQH